MFHRLKLNEAIDKAGGIFFSLSPFSFFPKLETIHA